MMQPVNRGSAASTAARSGRCGLVAITPPSASSVVRASPQRAVKRYVLRPAIAQATVFVASPRAIGRMPVASGSSVPPCPAFIAPVRRRTAPTAWLELMPNGLSSTIQPWIGVPFRLRAIAPAVVLFPLRLVVAAFVRLRFEVALNLRPVQQGVDAAGVVE